MHQVIRYPPLASHHVTPYNKMIPDMQCCNSLVLRSLEFLLHPHHKHQMFYVLDRDQSNSRRLENRYWSHELLIAVSTFIAAKPFWLQCKTSIFLDCWLPQRQQEYTRHPWSMRGLKLHLLQSALAMAGIRMAGLSIGKLLGPWYLWKWMRLTLQHKGCLGREDSSIK